MKRQLIPFGALLLMFSCSFGNVIPNRAFPEGGTLPNGGKIWALLAAGSREYENYRHQADVCHAYQILHKNGIPDENIIVMMFDDIARNYENPTPNVIINRPGGPNVYAGVPIDYRGYDVSAHNFLAVLSGNRSALTGKGSGRVINSGPNDHIFVYYADHGAPGLLSFPDDNLYARSLQSTLESMVAAKRFAKMVFYVDACESGSMFDGILSKTDNIFAVTSANPDEMAWACYWDDSRDTFLGDSFSVNWMENSEKADLMKESLQNQFEVVRKETPKSHVQEYGKLDMGSLPLAYFLGYNGSRVEGPSIKLHMVSQNEDHQDSVSSRDVHVERLRRKYESAADEETREYFLVKLQRALELRRHLDVTMSRLMAQVAHGDHEKTTHLLSASHRLTHDKLDCYESLVKYFSSKCFKISENPHALSKLKMFVNLCSVEWASHDSAKRAMDTICVPEGKITRVY